jgi:cell division septum initiation protein DivIVA
MADQIASMQNMIANLQAKNDVPPDLRPQSLLTPEERSEYGDEFLGVVAKKAKEELSPEVAALRQQINGLERKLEGTTASTHARARADMEASLDARLPQWREINFLQDFHSWLALPDTYSGAIRHNLLKTAYEQNNAPRVLAFFRGFLDHEAALAPPNPEPGLSAPQSNGKLPLESFAAPGRAKTAAASNAPAEKPIFTHAQIAQFYTESAAGKWKGREEEYNRIDRAIFEAGREGRVR